MKAIARKQLQGWRPIKTAPRKEYREVDVWVQWGTSPLTMGMSDAFRVTEAYRKNGKWVHRYKGRETELNSEFITHWMPISKPPKQ